MSQDKNATDRLVQNHYDEFCKMDISDKAIIQRVKDMKKYERAKTCVVEKKDRKGKREKEKKRKKKKNSGGGTKGFNSGNVSGVSTIC